MIQSSIQLLGFANETDIILSSTCEKPDNPTLIRVLKIVRSHEDIAHPYVLQGTIITSKVDASTDKPVILKLSMSPGGVASLEREYGFYSQQLASLQGNVIPKCFGLFKDPAFGGRTLGCLVLEHCKESPMVIKNLTDLEIDEDKYIRKFMEGLCQIHRKGVTLNHPNTNHCIRHGREPRIIDFSQAAIHVCPGAFPVLESAPAMVRNKNIYGKPACPELVAIEEEIVLGYKSSKSPENTSTADHHVRQGLSLFGFLLGGLL